MDAIRAEPDDEIAKLVYADWLQEQGEEDHAEFIRLFVAAERPVSVTISEADSFVLASDEKLRKVLSRLSNAIPDILKGRNAQYGLPDRIYGVRLAVSADVEDTGIFSIEQFLDILRDNEVRNLRLQIRDYINYGPKEKKWLEELGLSLLALREKYQYV